MRLPVPGREQHHPRKQQARPRELRAGHQRPQHERGEQHAAQLLERRDCERHAGDWQQGTVAAGHEVGDAEPEEGLGGGRGGGAAGEGRSRAVEEGALLLLLLLR